MRIFEQLIIVIAIIIVVITLDIITSKITENSIDSMLNKIDNISNLIDYNIQEAIKISSKIYEEWEEYENKMNFYLEHDELEKASKQIAILETQIQTNNITDAKQNISEIKFLLKHIEDKPKIKIFNIF